MDVNHWRDWVAEDFLEYVWGDREGWVDVPAKVGKYWVPFSFEWPADSVVTQRIDSSLRDQEDLYYSVCLFQNKGRAIGDCLANHWLWADLDEVHPTAASQLGFPPTVAIESSPGRFQALWRLHEELKPASLEKLNRGLSYALDADRGGWDLTQVLRVPGTRNFKYEGGPPVSLMWVEDGVRYDARAMWARLKTMLPPEELVEAVSILIPKKGVPAKARQLLRTRPDEVVPGERSARLWELECLLAESGFDEDQIFDLVWNSAWNKWRAQGTGRTRLVREIRKALDHVRRKAALKQAEPAEEALPAEGQPPGAEESPLRFVAYPSFMAMRFKEPKWMVQDIWAADAHGIIGGEPKTAKTTIGLALALAVASGKPFMGRYPVVSPGPVLFVQEENSPQMVQDRLRKLARLYGLLGLKDTEYRPARKGDLAERGSKVITGLQFPDEVPFWVMNNAGLDLSEEEHRAVIWEAVKQREAKMLVIDPLYLVLNTDTDRANLMRPFLQWLLDLRFEFNCAVVLVHHMRKMDPNKTVRPGQNLLGSTTLHAWVASGLYMSARQQVHEEWSSFKIEREFRALPPQAPIYLDLWMGEPGTLDMNVELNEYSGRGLIEQLVRDAGPEGLPVTKELLARVEMGRPSVERIAEASPVLEWHQGSRGRGNASRIIWVNGNGSQAS